MREIRTSGSTRGSHGTGESRPLLPTLLANTDDYPRAATVARSAHSSKVMIAASGYHREIRVLYPWKGERILCKGAVMTFYSFPNDGPFCDLDWVKRLEAAPPPEPPEWLKPLVVKP